MKINSNKEEDKLFTHSINFKEIPMLILDDTQKINIDYIYYQKNYERYPLHGN